MCHQASPRGALIFRLLRSRSCSPFMLVHLPGLISRTFTLIITWWESDYALSSLISRCTCCVCLPFVAFRCRQGLRRIQTAQDGEARTRKSQQANLRRARRQHTLLRGTQIQGEHILMVAMWSFNLGEVWNACVWFVVVWTSGGRVPMVFLHEVYTGPTPTCKLTVLALLCQTTINGTRKNALLFYKCPWHFWEYGCCCDWAIKKKKMLERWTCERTSQSLGTPSHQAHLQKCPKVWCTLLNASEHFQHRCRSSCVWWCRTSCSFLRSVLFAQIH